MTFEDCDTVTKQCCPHPLCKAGGASTPRKRNFRVELLFRNISASLDWKCQHPGVELGIWEETLFPRFFRGPGGDGSLPTGGLNPNEAGIGQL